MGTHEMRKSVIDTITAYQLAIENLPRPAMWFRAVQAREDGTTPGGIFSVLAELRMELQIQIGELSESSDNWNERNIQLTCKNLSASIRDRTVAYQLAIDSLPRPSMWFLAIGRRTDGTTPEGIFAALDEIRMGLQVRIGDLRDDSIRNVG